MDKRPSPISGRVEMVGDAVACEDLACLIEVTSGGWDLGRGSGVDAVDGD